jgi:hypothetical protein
MHLAGMLVDTSDLQILANMVQIIERNPPISTRCDDRGVEVAVRPLDCPDVELVRRGSGDIVRRRIARDDVPQVEVFSDSRPVYSEDFEDFWTGNYSTLAIGRPVEARNGRARRVDGVL